MQHSQSTMFVCLSTRQGSFGCSLETLSPTASHQLWLPATADGASGLCLRRMMCKLQGHFCYQGGCSCGAFREMVGNAHVNAGEFCLNQYVTSTQRMTFVTQLGRSGQIKLHLKWLEATFCVAADLRSLTLLATFAAKDEQQISLPSSL